MTKSKAEIIKIYQGLLDIFFSGVLALVVLKTLREEYQITHEERDDIFIVTLYLSTLNTAILALANTVKPSRESVNLEYLFNCILTSKVEFVEETYNLLVTFIPKFQAELESIEHTIESANQLRDTSVAHFDRRYINNPASLMQDQPMSWDDTKYAYNMIGSRLLDLGILLGLSDIEPYTTIANIELVLRTRAIFKFLYGYVKGGESESVN